MMKDGLLNEVYDIYNFNSDYTRGIRQAIGVREFKDVLGIYLSENDSTNGSHLKMPNNKGGETFQENMRVVLDSLDENRLRPLLVEAIDQMKVNTRRLVRRQRRRVNRLQTLFGWKIHCVDSTEFLSGKSNESWNVNVAEPAVNMIKSYIYDETNIVSDSKLVNCSQESKLTQRDLWTQHVCNACGNRVLRGAHEWEQHTKGRSHRKRVCSLKKSAATLPKP
jgi:tRNA dimethylallyltransferase